jgi:hypothetical protein
MANLYHEGKACDAVIRYLEAHGHTRRGKYYSPETDHHDAPIDLVCHIGDRLWGFEHTSIQAFEGQIEVDLHFTKFIEPIEKALASILPLSEQYLLYVPIDATRTLKGLAKEAIQKVRKPLSIGSA